MNEKGGMNICMYIRTKQMDFAVRPNTHTMCNWI